MPRQRMTPEDHAQRFWAKVQKTDTCWLWTGAIDRQDRYGHVSKPGGSGTAHRYAWEITHGPIPDGLCVCHTCDVRHCVNPAHLWLGTNRENILDAKAKGRLAYPGRGSANRLKTHCKRGHEYTPENTYRDFRNARSCRPCSLAGGKRRYAIKRARISEEGNPK